MGCWNNGILAPVKCEKKISRGKNVGFGGTRSKFYKGHSSEVKIRKSSVFNTHYFIVPPFHLSIGYLTADTAPQGWKQVLISSGPDLF